MSFFIARVRKFARRWKPTSPPPADELSCRELVELVTAYFDAALAEGDRARFEAHLAACPACTRYLAQMRITIETLGEIGLENIKPEAKSELMSAFRDWKSGAHHHAVD